MLRLFTKLAFEILELQDPQYIQPPDSLHEHSLMFPLAKLNEPHGAYNAPPKLAEIQFSKIVPETVKVVELTDEF